jgi:hypothetical protein
LIQRCACVGLCVTFDGSKMRNSSTKSNCHCWMNRRPVGSVVGTSGEGVWALSCLLLEIFTPSETDASRLLTIGSSGAEDFFPSSQTRAQLLRRVVILGRRTIRWLLSPRSISAPTIRPTLVFLHRRIIRRYTDALVPPVITVRRDSPKSLTLIPAAAPAQSAAAPLASSDPHENARACATPPVLRRVYALAAGRRAISTALNRAPRATSAQC